MDVTGAFKTRELGYRKRKISPKSLQSYVAELVLELMLLQPRGQTPVQKGLATRFYAHNVTNG